MDLAISLDMSSNDSPLFNNYAYGFLDENLVLRCLGVSITKAFDTPGSALSYGFLLGTQH